MSYILDDRKTILAMFPFMEEYGNVWLDVRGEHVWLEGTDNALYPDGGWWSSCEAPSIEYSDYIKEMLSITEPEEKITVASLVEKYHRIKGSATH